MTAHDGFTLRDCVCFTNKHNEANGEENRDGTSNNYSDNHGKEGLGGSLDLIERRRDSIHALLTTLLLSQGTPMLLAGDEHGHSQHGNNNAYCQDTPIAWVNWEIEERGRQMILFTYRLIALRKRFPILHRGRFLTGKVHEKLDVKDVSWFMPNGDEMTEEAWGDAHAKCIGMLLDGRAQPTGLIRYGSLSTVLILFNAAHEDVVFSLPSVAHGESWRHIMDTFQPDDINEHHVDFGSEYTVRSRTTVLFELISHKK